MPLTKEQRQANMAKARAARTAKHAIANAPSDGESQPEALAKTAVITEGGWEQRPPGFENFKAVVDSADIIGKSFTTPEGTNGIRMLVVPGDNIQELPMRADFPDRQFLVACARVIARCRIYEDKEGEAEVLFIVAGLCGIKGKRADMLVDSILGERRNNFRKQTEGFMNKAKHYAGLDKPNGE